MSTFIAPSPRNFPQNGVADLQFSVTLNLNNCDTPIKKEDNSLIFRSMTFLQRLTFQLIFNPNLPPEDDIKGVQCYLPPNLSYM